MENTLKCIECGAGTDRLYDEFSKGNIRLRRCVRCGAVVDRYVEYDLILIGLDLALLRLPAYRHLLFNRQMYNHLKLGVFVRFLVVYLSLEGWIKGMQVTSGAPLSSSLNATHNQWLSMAWQWTQCPLLSPAGAAYPRLLAVSLAEFAGYFAGVWLAVQWLFSRRRNHHAPSDDGDDDQDQSLCSASELLGALLVSSFGKLLFFLMMVWPYDAWFFGLFNGFVFFSNVVGVQALLNCSYGTALLCCISGRLLVLLVNRLLALLLNVH